MKIGILTHYYKSNNYGGNLQAFALVKFLNKLGYDAEQISYKRGDDYIFSDCPVKRDYLLIKFAKSIINSIRKYNINKRIRAINRFNQGKIPHSKIVYNNKNIKNISDKYDVFITGSDQVWHPQAVCDAYLLNFDSKGTKKISYAASFSVDKLPQNVKDYYKKCLSDIESISVREEKGCELVEQIIGKKPTLVLDPTLLLSKNDWSEIIEETENYGKYIFCYFLGSDGAYREKATAFAKEKGYIIVTLPHLNGIVKADKEFGDKRLFNVSPGQLLSLIKNSEYVMTDSYHISVFSIIYEKQFVALDRYGMGSRIKTLTELFGVTEHFCDTKEKSELQYILSLDKIYYNKVNRSKYNNLLEISKDFLINALCM